MKKQFLEVGQIVSTHGIKGEIRLNPWCDSPAFLKQFKTLYFDGEGQKSVGVQSVRPHGNIVIMKLENIDTIEQAQTLRNKILYMNRADTKEGTVYIQDLIDCEVYDADTNAFYGKIKSVTQNPANNIWHIVDTDGKESLFPAVKPFIESIDTDGCVIKIKPIKGMFTPAEEIRDED